jgi:hypothetical protein
MRWFVEVASSSQKEAPEQWVVEATQWQPALQAARSLRGEAVEMSGFSIELLEDGFRAIDPTTFIRYVVRRAPDGTPVSQPKSKPSGGHASNGGGASAKPAARSTQPSQPPPGSKAERIAALLDIGAGGPPRPASRPPGPTPASQKPVAPGAPAAPRPASQPPRPHPSVPTGLQALAGAQPAALPAPPVPVIASAAASASSEALPPAELLFKREEDPSPSSPLTYRETAWAVPEGTSTEAAVRLLMGMFEGVRAALAGVQPGKFVNMAVFDHQFQGKPKRPPLATLAWKDWKDQGEGPQIRRLGESSSILPPSSHSMPPPAFVAAAAPAPAPLVPPVAAPAPAPLVSSPAPAPAPAPLVSAVAAPAPLVSAVAAPAPLVSAVAAPAPLVSAVAVPAPAPLVSPVAAPAPAPLAATAAAVAEPTPAPLVVPPPPPVPEPLFPQASSAASVPEAAPIDLNKPKSSPPSRPSSPSIPASRGSIPSVPGARLSGDELITTLFEAMHDLNFLRDAFEGADFVLSLIMDKLPSTVGLVHFYDINSREFVVVRAVGPGATKAIQARTSEKDPLVVEAMRGRRAVVIADATGDERAQKGRWSMIDVACRSLVCAPVEQGGRFLGLLELSNPRDGGPFKEGDGHALTYLGEQFAEFLAARGIVLHPDRLTPPTGIVALKK